MANVTIAKALTDLSDTLVGQGDGGNVEITGGEAADGGTGGSIFLTPGTGGAVFIDPYVEAWAGLVVQIAQQSKKESPDQNDLFIKINSHEASVPIEATLKKANEMLEQANEEYRVSLMVYEHNPTKNDEGIWEVVHLAGITLRDVELVDLVNGT